MVFFDLQPTATDRIFYPPSLPQDCMKVATANNYYIVTHIHLDDGDEKGSWRNSLIFDPSQK